MSWDKKSNGKSYYYRSVRMDGVSRKIYCGKGAVGQKAEQEDLAASIEKNRIKSSWNIKLNQLDALKRTNSELAEITLLLVRSKLILAGYYQHNGGGAWRKRKGSRK